MSLIHFPQQYVFEPFQKVKSFHSYFDQMMKVTAHYIWSLHDQYKPFTLKYHPTRIFSIEVVYFLCSVYLISIHHYRV